MTFSDEQLFIATVAYETSRCDIPMDEFLHNVEKRYEEATSTYKKHHKSTMRTGNKSKLGL